VVSITWYLITEPKKKETPKYRNDCASIRGEIILGCMKETEVTCNLDPEY
jgi:hypothetical protein